MLFRSPTPAMGAIIQTRARHRKTVHRQMSAGGASKGNDPTNLSLVVVEYLGPRPSKSLSSDPILLAHALTVRPHLFVSKNPEKPKNVSVDLTRHTYDGRCKRLRVNFVGQKKGEKLTKFCTTNNYSTYDAPLSSENWISGRYLYCQIT